MRHIYMIIIEGLRFEWDPEKERKNQQKHDVSFEEAQTVFRDEFARILGDPDHSEDEERFILLGRSEKQRLLMVVHCYGFSHSDIRIISARKATPKERRQYEEFLP